MNSKNIIRNKTNRIRVIAVVIAAATMIAISPAMTASAETNNGLTARITFQDDDYNEVIGKGKTVQKEDSSGRQNVIGSMPDDDPDAYNCFGSGSCICKGDTDCTNMKKKECGGNDPKSIGGGYKTCKKGG